MADLILIRYGEMTLKKKNYHQFLNQINKTIKTKLKAFPEVKFSNTQHRAYIELNGTDPHAVCEVLAKVTGLHSYSLGYQVPKDYEAIAKRIAEMLNSQHKTAYTFKLETNRADKTYRDTSPVITQEVAKRLLPRLVGATVDVHNPEVIVTIDWRYEGVFVFTDSIPGLKGFPGGSGGRALLLASGGIDSPVAGFLTLKKGVYLEAIHFASPPYTSKQSLDKVLDLMKVVSEYTSSGTLVVHVINLTHVQELIQTHARHDYLITLMRRAMMKISTNLAKQRNLDALVTGESIGQVASQTIESMSVVNNATDLLILRPLLAYDKDEIVKVAKRINTFEISILPYEDCCTVFVPDHPVIKPNLEIVLQEEARCNWEEAIMEASNNYESYLVNCHEVRKMENNDGTPRTND